MARLRVQHVRSPDDNVAEVRKHKQSTTCPSQQRWNFRVERFSSTEHRHENGLLRRNDGDVASHIEEDDDNAFTEWRSAMRACSRRQALGIIAGTSIAVRGKMSIAAPAQQSLGAIAAQHGFVFGAAAGPVIDKDLAYRELYMSQTRIVTTDIAMKMGTIAPQPGPKRFESADRLLQFCASNRIPMRGHCLIWNEWVPPWVRNLSVAERQKFFDGYIEEVVGRYVGKLQSWDIVNEPFWPGHKAPGGYRLGQNRGQRGGWLLLPGTGNTASREGASPQDLWLQDGRLARVSNVTYSNRVLLVQANYAYKVLIRQVTRIWAGGIVEGGFRCP